LHDLINHYNYLLRFPFRSDLPKQDWFHGDITTDEATELLKDKIVGTFLLRFSSRGSFAASFVDSTKQVRHVLIETQGKDNFVVDTGSGIVAFKSIPELVQFYIEKQVFLFPLVAGN